MRYRLWIAAAVSLIAFTPAKSRGMTFERAEATGGYVVILTGVIQAGDSGRLGAFFGAQPSGHFLGFGLNSPGGNLLEAERMAGGIHALHTLTVILKENMCASACFLLFAASDRRLIQPGAALGVHSASTGGTEDLTTMGLTTAFARDLSAYGVPPDIIGQLVTTTADHMNWLTIEQLQEMGVKFATPQPSTQPDPTPPQAFGEPPARVQASASTPLPTTPSTLLAPSASITASIPAQAPVASKEGLSDRKAWEAWVAGLAPSSHQGAEFWASQRSLPHPIACETQMGVDSDWKSACVEARQRLALSDFRRHHEPAYKAGWNAL